MRFVGIDLAERWSAAVCIDAEGTVLYESNLDTGPKENPPNPFAKALALAPWWMELWDNTGGQGETYWVVEDIPPHTMADPKPVLKLQGALIGYMVLSGIEMCHLIHAKIWQDFYGYSKKEFGDSKKWAALKCAEFGYTPGCSLPVDTKIKAKPLTDLRDAYLLARWLRDVCLG